MKVALTGASGFVASHLIKEFNDYIIIDRNDNEDDILEKLKDVDAVFNLAGAPIIKKWNEEYKKTLVSSRIDTTKKLVNAINKSDVGYFISTSAIGAYPNDAKYDESFQSYGDDFLASLTKEWEAEALKCNKKTAIVRFGVILGKEGGALKQMLTPFKLGLGGTIGNGKMMTSWIDIDDLVNIYLYLSENKLTGIFNATAPKPVSNYEFTKALGKTLNRPTVFPIPTFVLKLIFGEASSVLTDSKEVYPKALENSGFEFKYKTIEKSLEHLLK
ncbi:TIGR01777 family protein [Sulfurimonas lithotrophica]|uniref:TIGR01777 family protein n=1 Tax=Sulfurimonas lithotrophica TaxID=2590022 RepID=A0A5P8NY93_9BACT|nr:TIGR01777 family oxidoreductase [Sulfurimonas lithotrophica]QFR48403.1 TIGR01777 family protein [Sulfurimonas lithotrophica]